MVVVKRSDEEWRGSDWRGVRVYYLIGGLQDEEKGSDRPLWGRIEKKSVTKKVNDD